jgi:hypothetical protein
MEGGGRCGGGRAKASKVVEGVGACVVGCGSMGGHFPSERLSGGGRAVTYGGAADKHAHFSAHASQL